MDTENKIQRITKLIIRSVHTPLSEEEQQELDVWRIASRRNDRLYRKLTEQDFSEEDYSRFQRMKQTDDWMVLQKKIGTRRRKRMFSVKQIARYAAVLVVGVLTVYVLMQTVEISSMPEDLMVEQVIRPGQSKAILEVQDGVNIELGQDNMMNSELLSKRGILEGSTSIVYIQEDSVAVENHVLRVPRGGEYILMLADGTKVWINSESVLHFPNRFQGNERRVQVEGEAYFQVAKNESQPFIVETDGMDIRVTGTEFNVMAYKDQGQVETTLVEGSVMVNAGGQIAKMTPGDQTVFSKNDMRLTTRQVNTGLYTSWKDGIFEFKDLSLREIAEYLGRWYDVEFVFGDERVAEIRFTGAVKKMKPITFILDVIKSTKAVDYQIEGKTVIVEKK